MYCEFEVLMIYYYYLNNSFLNVEKGEKSLIYRCFKNTKLKMEILIIIGLILLNGFFSMSEIAVVSARKSKLMSEAKAGSKSAAYTLRLIEEPDKFLSTVQIGITLIGILTGIYSGATFSSDFAAVLERISISPMYAPIIAQASIVIVVTYLTIVFGELIPKKIGMNAATKVAKVIAQPMHVLSLMATPFVWLLSQSTTVISKLIGIKDADNQVTEEEIKTMIHEGTTTGEVQVVEQDIVERVFSLGDRNIGSLMTPRNEIVWIDINSSNQEIKRILQENSHITYPVADKDLDRIVGTVSLNDLFNKLDDELFSIEGTIRQALFLHEGTEVYKAFDQMKETHTHYAIICDEFGIVQGIVTDHDILEGLVGELPEAHEELSIVQRQDGSWLIDGQCEFYHFLEYFELESLYAEHKYNTLSGLVLDVLGHIPKAGETLEWNMFSIEVVDMDGARIDKLLVDKLDKH